MTNNGAMEPTPEVLRQWAQALVVSAHARWKETLRGIDYDAQVAANENAVRMETIKDWLLAEATRREAEAGERSEKFPISTWLSYYEDADQLRECAGKNAAAPPDDDTLYRRADIVDAEIQRLQRRIEELEEELDAACEVLDEETRDSLTLKDGERAAVILSAWLTRQQAAKAPTEGKTP